MPNRLLTRIIGTLGPASQNHDTVVEMIQAGMRVVRINCSHGTTEDFARYLDIARKAEETTQKPLAVMADLCGPKVRLGDVPDGPLNLEKGQKIILHTDDIAAHIDGEIVHLGTNCPQAVCDTHVGHRVYFADGTVRLKVTDKQPDALHCQVVEAGAVSRRKGINLPDTHLSIPTITDWDVECAQWAVENGVDYIALSFVRDAEDIVALKRLLHRFGGGDPRMDIGNRVRTIAKIEVPRAIDHLQSICEQADAIMVARGDLGVEMDLAEVPLLQKRILEEAHNQGKPTIVATQMLESMINNATPTRAEIADIATAVIDGTDATMLSGETAIGNFPVGTIQTMAHASYQASTWLSQHQDLSRKTPVIAVSSNNRHRPTALAHGVHAVSRAMNAKCVAVWTEFGGSARYLSQIRTHLPVVALSANKQTLRQMNLLRDVIPVEITRPTNEQELLRFLDSLLPNLQLATKGDPIIVVTGTPFGVPGATNSLAIHYINEAASHPQWI